MIIIERIKSGCDSVAFNVTLYKEFSSRGDLNFNCEKGAVYNSLLLIKEIKSRPVFKGTIFENSADDFLSWFENSKVIDFKSFTLKVRALLLL